MRHHARKENARTTDPGHLSLSKKLLCLGQGEHDVDDANVLTTTTTTVDAACLISAILRWLVTLLLPVGRPQALLLQRLRAPKNINSWCPLRPYCMLSPN